MPRVHAQYPDQVWDGLTPNTWRESRRDQVDPNFNDWDQIAAEVIATQTKLDESGGLTSRCRVYFDGNQVVPGFAPTKITFNHIDFDGDSEWDADNNRFIVKEAGYYMIVGSLNFPNLETLGFIMLIKNAAVTLTNFSATISNGLTLQATNLVYLEAGDYVELWGLHTQSSIEISGGTANTYLCIHRLS